MGGFWRLAAMSAVIGAGLVVVWQAHQGLNSASATSAEADAPQADTDAATASAQPIDESTADAELLSLGPALTPSRKTPEPVATASVPPEEAADELAGPALAPPPSTSPRYRPGLNFKQEVPAADPFDSQSTAVAEPEPEPAVDNDPFASTTPEPLPPAPLAPNQEAAQTAGAEMPADALDGGVILTGGKKSEPQANEPSTAPNDDPFSGAAPPEFGSEESLRDTRPVREPAPAEPPTIDLGPAADDPFANPGRPDPRAVAQPARSLDVGVPNAQPQRRKFPPLPLDLDDPANAAAKSTPSIDVINDENPPPRSSARQPAPLSFDGPGSQPAPSPAKGAAPPARLPDPKDPLVGDGLITAGAPRGVQEPRLTIEKIAPAKAALGQELVYAVLVKNIGGSPASQVTVEDRIPKGARLIGTYPRAELVDKRLIWKLGTLQPNDERKISIKVVPEEEGPLGSVAKVNFVSEVAAEIVITAPQLKLRVSSPSTATMGEKVQLMFTITNAGDGNATNVVLRSVLPEGLRHPSGSDLEYVVGDLPAKQSREVPLELTAVKPGRITHRATVQGDGNANAEAEITIDVQGEQLVLTRRGQPRLFVGRAAVFLNQVVNEGEKPVSRVKVSEVVPAGFEFVEASDGGRFDPDTRTISWNVGPIAPGTEQSVSAKLMPKSVGEYEGVVTASGPTGSVAQVKASVAVEGFPSLTIEPMGDERVLAVGERLTSQIQLRNNGSAAANRVGLTIEVPAELKIVSAKGPATHQVLGSRIVFDPIGELSPRDRATYEIVVEALSAGDARLELQIFAEHLRRPVRHEEALQVVDAAQ